MRLEYIKDCPSKLWSGDGWISDFVKFLKRLENVSRTEKQIT